MNQPENIPVVDGSECAPQGNAPCRDPRHGDIARQDASSHGTPCNDVAEGDTLRHDARNLIRFGAVLIVAGAVLHATGIGCPLRFLTGIPCPGCGMTRAWLAILHLDVVGAATWHPLFWALPLMGTLYLARHRLGTRRINACVGILIALFLMVWGVRLVLPGDAISIAAPRWLEVMRTVLG